ncbi:MAG: hypothetical protein KKA42_02565 [candidate division Zixibacteria bacterium]|nr:hypothetical protein [candidate division Zixibacteria bacterium]
MFKQIFTRMIATIVVLGAFIAVGCTEDGDADSSGFMTEVVDSLALAVAENIAADSNDAQKRTGTPVVPALDLAVTAQNGSQGAPPINDFITDGDLVYAVDDLGLSVYDLASEGGFVLEGTGALKAVAEHAGDVYVGGEQLYRVIGTELFPDESLFKGGINVLYSYGPSLMVGTTEGLYMRNILGCLPVLEEMNVTSLVADEQGLWIGTDGDGLYRWDGEEFKRRFLARDRSLFDRVTSLDANHGHLYMGTPNGMFVYNGGSWREYTVEDGLPANEVVSIDANGWYVYVGTASGVATFHEGTFTPTDKLESRQITVVKRKGGKVFAGTVGQGLLLKNGPTVRTLIGGASHQTDPGLASLAR